MLLATLKHETHPYHLRLEADLRVLDARFELADYRRLLEGFYGFYRPWENKVGSRYPELLEGRSKVARLIADLQYLGASEDDIRRLPICTALPPLRTLGNAVGSMYVIEGSTLGGLILRRHFTARFGFAERGCEFFSHYGSRTGPMWKQFGAMVNALPEEFHQDAISSAIATFQAIHDWLCRESIAVLPASP